MRVLIFGATGLIGRTVVRAIVAAGHDTVAMTRKTERAAGLKAAWAQPIVGDITMPETWHDAAAATDAAIHLAAAFEGDLAAADRIWTEAMDALARAGKAPQRIVYTGGCWLYPARSAPPITEADGFDPLPPFAHLVAHRDRLRASGLDVVTLHPGLVWSDTAGCTAEIDAAVAAQQPVEVVGSPETLWPLVHADDLAALYAGALRPDAPCTDILAVSDPGIPVASIIAAAERVHGMRASLRTLPVAEAVRRHGSWVAGKARSQRIEGARAAPLLGWRPKRRFPVQ
ncbi:MAG: NAD-dependent epimerase/dehydratase family protein [Alkalilacustris sp.]